MVLSPQSTSALGEITLTSQNKYLNGTRGGRDWGREETVDHKKEIILDSFKVLVIILKALTGKRIWNQKALVQICALFQSPLFLANCLTFGKSLKPL